VAVGALVALGLALVWQGCGTETGIVLAARSPYELARYIDSHRNFEWAPLEKALELGGGLMSCEAIGDCPVELITVLEPQQTLLLVDTPGGNELIVRYFGDGSRGWQRAGAEVFWIKNYQPRHAVTNIGRKPFLRVSQQGSSGSDISSENEAWFDLTRRDFKAVFGFQPDGIQSRLSFGISRHIKAHASPRVDGEIEAIEVYASVRYSIWSVELGQEDVCGTYERRANSISG
jgi:hypothetical protein